MPNFVSTAGWLKSYDVDDKKNMVISKKYFFIIQQVD
jgi:hypothetical protein